MESKAGLMVSLMVMFYLIILRSYKEPFTIKTLA